jgi:hypothetical protein
MAQQLATPTSWRQDPLVLLGNGPEGLRIWPFDKTLTKTQQDNAFARLILLSTTGAALYTRQPSYVLGGGLMMGALYWMNNPQAQQQSSSQGSKVPSQGAQTELKQQLPTQPGFNNNDNFYTPIFTPPLPEYPREGYWQGDTLPVTWVPSPFNGSGSNPSSLDSIYQHSLGMAAGDYWNNIEGSMYGGMPSSNMGIPLHQTAQVVLPPGSTTHDVTPLPQSIEAMSTSVDPRMNPTRIPPNYINTTAMGPVPQEPSVAVPPNRALDETAFDPSLASNPFAIDAATRLAAHNIDVGRNASNPYGNPLPFDSHYAVDGELPRQPNEMDVHFETFKSAQRDVKKMFGPTGELDEGLFINGLSDPTLFARPVNFIESSEWDRHIVGDFVTPYRQTM